MKTKVNLKQKLANLKRAKQNQNQSQNRVNGHRKLSRHAILTIAALAILVIAHIAILWAIFGMWRYYPIYPALFMSLFGILICSVIIIDIVFFIGFNHKDLALKIISSVMAVLLLIGGTIGARYISKANVIVNNVLDDGKSDKYETFSGVFVCYDKYNTFTSLEDLAGKKVGLLLESSDGITYIANKELSKAKIDFATVDYKTNAEMMQALIDGDVDAIAITSAYRTIYQSKETTVEVENNTEEGEGEDTVEETDIESEEETQSEEGTEAPATEVIEESPFAKYLDNLVDFYSFEEELKVNTNRSTKNLSKDPFNVLLIGYSRTDIGSPVGLADSIILTTINPQTYTVSMTSIARDSFVPIPCYGGEYDKINSGRSTSRACFIETVENFLDMEIDYYMELDYLGLVQIVNVIGGIEITNPVEFTLDGIYVPAGKFLADGQQALQFCRERHHMPGGDFDRQQHQKEVIMAIARKFIESRDITLALKAMEEASDWMSTDMTLTQLTNVFNLLLNTRNYTSLDTFDLVDFQNSRITGYGGILYYSMSMRLPLWVYLIYQGSYDESVKHINEMMGNFETVKQDKNFEFNLDNEYFREPFYSTEYEKRFLFEPDPMPAYWYDLGGYSLSAAQDWANANGVNLSVEVINMGDPGFDASMEGLIVDQSVRYGSLVSEYRSGTVYLMGVAEVDESKMVPDFIEHSYKKAIEWAEEYGIPYSIDFDDDIAGKVGDVIEQDPKPYTDIDKVEKLRLVVKSKKYTIKFDKNGHGTTPDSITVETGDKVRDLPWLDRVTENGTTYAFEGWYTEKSGGTRIYTTDDVSDDTTLYAHWEDVNHEHGDWTNVVNATCTAEGSQVCGRCGKTVPIPALGHDWVESSRTPATCTADGSVSYKCSRCNETKTETLTATGHSWGEWILEQDGKERRYCSNDSSHVEERTPESSGDSSGNGENTGG